MARLDLAGWEGDFEHHLACRSDVDIAVDRHRCHGTTTTCEALWTGVPVVTLAVAVHVFRVGVSSLTRAGHPEWVASNANEYVRIAADPAADREALSQHRAKLRETLRNSPLTEAALLARGLEQAFSAMVASRRSES